MKQTKEKNEAITLIALIITILVLLILAGITLNLVLGENGILSKAMETKEKQIRAEMREKLSLSLQELQIEKLGQATLDDLTQEWLDQTIKDYACTLKNDTATTGKVVTMQKDGITGKFLIDDILNIVDMIADESTIGFEYETISKDGEDIKIQVKVTENTNGIKQIQTPDGNTINGQAKKEVQFEYTVTLGVEYEFKITSESGEQRNEKIKIEDYYYKITKNLENGISIDNKAIKAAYNKPYEAKIIVGDEYIIDTIMVTMGAQAVAVDKTTGMIRIEKVTGDITITATAKKIEIQVSNPIIGTANPPTTSVNDNSQTKTTKLYINFSATLDGNACTITPSVPYEITSNGTYQFTATAEYQGKTITKEIEIKANKYQSADGVVKYDAGEWTKEEIEELQTSCLYDLNASRSQSKIFKLKDSTGINLTFGGFTYKGSADSSIDDIVTSRNQSVTPEQGNAGGYGKPNYDGWQILEKTEDTTTGRTYVTKIIHAGSPENFVYTYTTANDAYRAMYLLSGGSQETGYSKLSDGTQINVRNWDMYKDKNQLDLIDEVHCMTKEEASAISGAARNINSTYWVVGRWQGTSTLPIILMGSGNINGMYSHCFGLRPVVSLKDGVYIASGTGTDADPYVLAKE